MKKWMLVSVAILVVAAAITQIFTLFVVQPIGILPEGRTVLIWRLNKTKFIDSPDAMCEREMGGVNLLCRGAALSAVVKNNNIIMRFPYSEFLYLLSTGGKSILDDCIYEEKFGCL